MRRAMNFVAVLAVLAATAFALPLLVQAGQAAGLARGASVALSLVVASLLALALATRAILAARRRRIGRPASGAVRRTAPVPGASRAAAGLVEPQATPVRAGLRRIEAEEESRAGL